MMSTMTRTVKVERIIPVEPGEAFDAWLDPTVPGAFGHDHEELLIDLKVDGLWFWRSVGGTPHYGRFLTLQHASRIEHTWMSPNTRGLESTVTITFEPLGDRTRMTIEHAGLPDDDMAAAHERGWTAILGRFTAVSKS